MPDNAPFEYVVVRLVPRVDRQEFINCGVILISRPKRFLAARFSFDRDRLMSLYPDLDEWSVDEVASHLRAMEGIARGDLEYGPIAGLEMGERWHWLAAPSSTIIQPSPIHTGITSDPERELAKALCKVVPAGSN